MFAALSTIEPPIVELSMASLVEREKSWYAERQSMLEERVHRRLGELAARLGGSEWLDGPFSTGDLLMVTVLRRSNAAGLLGAHGALAAYVARGEARPAFQRAFAAQLEVFTGKAQNGG